MFKSQKIQTLSFTFHYLHDGKFNARRMSFDFFFIFFSQFIASHFGGVVCTPNRSNHIICANYRTMIINTIKQLNDRIIGIRVRVILLPAMSVTSTTTATHKKKNYPTPFEMQTKNHIHKNQRCLWHQTPLTLGSCSLARHQISICIYWMWMILILPFSRQHWLWIVKNRKWA